MTDKEFDRVVSEMIAECPSIGLAELYCQLLELLDDMVLEKEMSEDEASAHMDSFGERLLLGSQSPSRSLH